MKSLSYISVCRRKNSHEDYVSHPDQRTFNYSSKKQKKEKKMKEEGKKIDRTSTAMKTENDIVRLNMA